MSLLLRCVLDVEALIFWLHKPGNEVLALIDGHGRDSRQGWALYCPSVNVKLSLAVNDSALGSSGADKLLMFENTTEAVQHRLIP